MNLNNLKAFLDMIAWSEGTTRIKGSDNGYNVLVGGTLFEGYADHPRKRIKLSETLYSTAAGRYQILARYFDYYKKLLNLTDFCPASQDAIAVQYIKERKAMTDVLEGRIEQAIQKCARIWASLPGAGYGQHENKLERLIAEYKKAGGIDGLEGRC